MDQRDARWIGRSFAGSRRDDLGTSNAMVAGIAVSKQ